MVPSTPIIESSVYRFPKMFTELRKFSVPWHQRRYDWGKGDVQELLDDIDEAIRERQKCYFLGTVILVEKENHQKWEINDGQQRMITLSLIYATLCRRFHDEHSDSQHENICLRMLFDLDAESVCSLREAGDYTPRIDVADVDSRHYRPLIRGEDIGATSKLVEAWKTVNLFFSLRNIAQCRRYLNFIQEKLEISCLRVPSSIDSNAVYETVNCRGRPLNDFDRIRNYLYSHFSETASFQKRCIVHESLENIRTQIIHADKASEYLRCYLQCRFGFLRKDHFYRDTRQAFRNSGKSGKRESQTRALNLAKNIGNVGNIELFRTLTAPKPDPDFVKAFKIASGTTNSPRGMEVFLRELSAYKVAQPLVFSLLEKFHHQTTVSKKKAIARIANRNLRRLTTFLLRTAFVTTIEPSGYERDFSNYAKNIMEAKSLPDNEFKAFLTDCDQSSHGILDDQKFYDALLSGEMKGITKIKSFLLGLDSGTIVHERFFSIEHILPKSEEHWHGWTKFSECNPRDWIHRIGNLTLLRQTDNRPGRKDNKNFKAKQRSYKNSEFELTRELCNYEEWSPQTIESRQRMMAKKAVEIWKFV